MRGNWIQTYTGRVFYPLDPRPEDVCLEDIAHALSMLCRFGGHCSRFYSVAEHSVFVSHLVPMEYALQALLHDAAEAYVIDVPRPLKKHLIGYDLAELNVWKTIAARFGLVNELHQTVKEVDDACCLAEMEQIMLPPKKEWMISGTPANIKVVGYSPKEAEYLFLSRYTELQLYNL